MDSMRTAIYKILTAVALVMLCAAGCYAKNFKVIIDAGHGGKDHGALGTITNEKSINLGVALKLGKLIEKNMKDVDVVFTRDDDTFISLQGRAEKANKEHGDLFISIHTNSVDKASKNRTTVKGSATYVLGLHRTNDNFEVAKRENSVIQLEDDYSETNQGFDPNSSESYIIFELSQSQHLDQSISFAQAVQHELMASGQTDNGVRQAGFWVLAKTSMPAVLIELDFICNPNREAMLASEEGQSTLAKAIFEAFKSYKRINDRKAAAAAKAKSGSQPSGKNKGGKGDKKKGNAAPSTPKDIASSAKSVKASASDKKNRKDKAAEATVDYDNRDNVGSDRKETTSSTIYKVLLFSSTKQLQPNAAEFKKLTPVEIYFENGSYLYTYGEAFDRNGIQKVLATVKKNFPGAKIIKFVDGVRVNE